MEKIEVRYKPLFRAGNTYFHKYLVYTEAVCIVHATFRRTNSACVSPPPRFAN
jgi:hypothetical protein